MSSPIAALLQRLNALEAKVTAQAETIELMSLMTPLEALNEGLKGAEPSAKKEFVALMKAMIDEHWSAEAEDAEPAKGLTIKTPSAKGSKKEPKAEKPKRAATNPTGPAAYNAKLQQVWQEMVEDAGVEVEEGKLVEAAKTAKVSYRDAQRETAIRQIMEEESKERAEAEALFAGRKADAKAAKEAKKAGTPKPEPTVPPKAAPAKASTPKPKKAAAAKAEPKADAEEIAPASAPAAKAEKPKAAAAPEAPAAEDEAAAKFAAELVEVGMVEKEIAGKVYYYAEDSGEVYGPKIEGVFDLGELAGIFEPATGKIVKPTPGPQ